MILARGKAYPLVSIKYNLCLKGKAVPKPIGNVVTRESTESRRRPTIKNTDITISLVVKYR